MLSKKELICKNCGIHTESYANEKIKLCIYCNEIVFTEFTSTWNVISDSIRIIGESNNLRTQLSRCDLIIEKIKGLLKWEHLGITQTPLSEFIKDIEKLKKELLECEE